MPTPSLPQSKVAEILSLLEKGGMSNKEIGKKVGASEGVVSKVKNKYRATGNSELPGEINVPVDTRDGNKGDTLIVTPDKPLTLDEMAALFNIDRKVWKAVTFVSNQWQGFYKCSKVIKNGESKADHRKVSLFQTRVTWQRIMGESIQDALLEFFKEHVRPLPKPRLVATKTKPSGDDHMVTWGIWDAHLGLYAWHSEVGESMDLTKAVSRVTNSIDDMAQKIVGWPNRVSQIVMPIGNDFLHYDNVRQKTTHGDHHLDADGRYAKVYAAALRCLVYMIERALDICDDVQVLYVPGNHDLTSSYTLCVALAQRFLNDPRVKFDLRANPRKRVVFGQSLIAFDHGQGANAKQLALILAQECKDVWSNCTYREIQVGHVHQRRVTEFESVTPTNGVTVRTNPALSAVDVWHHTQGLIGEPVKSVAASFYSSTGYVGELVAWARDDFNEAIKDIPLTNR